MGNLWHDFRMECLWQMISEGSDSTGGSVRACHAAARVQSQSCAGEACGDLLLALQQWRLRISRGSHGHVNGGAVSLTLSGT